MSMTMTQKILAAHAGVSEVKSGQLLEANLDMILGNDVTSPVAINVFEKCGAKQVFDKAKITLVMDHFTPNKDIKSAQNCKQVRNFAKKHHIINYYDVGKMGIEHAFLPEQGLVIPGDCIIGADSHTCTYGALGAFSTGVGSTDMAAAMITGKAWFKVPSAIKVILTGNPSKFVCGKDIILYLIGKIGVDGALYRSLEFYGDGIKNLSMDSRFTIANMAIEAGAKNGIFPVDNITRQYMEGRTTREYYTFEADKDAFYDQKIEINLSKLSPMVAFPPLPENTLKIENVDKIKIDQVVIGSCTNGRMEDMRAAAEILKGRKIANDVRCIVIPATPRIYLECITEGIIQIFLESGCAVSTPTCGPCLGGHMGILAEGERAVTTTNRNFVGRMGHPNSEIYLANPYTAAASAVTGYLTNPIELER